MRKVIIFTITLLIVGGFLANLNAEISEDTKASWKKNCAKCHADDGSGDTKIGKKLEIKDYTTVEFQEEFTDEELFKLTKDGVPDSKMRGYGAKLSDEEINELVVLMRSFKKE